ncbi:hypothetical protein HNQ60_004108 [Povalibacter uvarum]|uniref:Uncharacterized protein n=1 Tax=Povalibacter uvarum TaxID=732238 RepID=A0A841HT79_9GAMM|nr:hypothetical protein [Povalibacter uvarum]MBB6095218.1 hypothetical protein [Povalibacter uvarum]
MNQATTVRSACLAIVVLSGVLGTGNAQTPGSATNATLKGAFSVQAEEECVHSSTFGPPPVLEALGPTVMENITIQGTLTLNGDGTGEFVGRSASITTIAIASPVQQSTLRCPVTYSMDRGGVVSLERTCTGTVTRGSLSVGAQVWTASAVRLEGRFHSVTGALQLADTALEIETITSFRGARTPRLCTRAWSAFRIERPR